MIIIIGENTKIEHYLEGISFNLNVKEAEQCDSL